MEPDVTGTIDSSASNEFMLKEYELLHLLMLDEKSRGEQRINYFLTISTGAVGVLVVLSQLEMTDNVILYYVTLGVLLILLMFGLITLNRVISRSVQMSHYIGCMVEIRGFFLGGNPALANYVSSRTARVSSPKLIPHWLLFIVRRMTGSLAEFMVVANSLLVGGIILVLLSYRGFSVDRIILWTSVVVSVMLVTLIAYVFVMRRQLMFWQD